MPVPTYVAYCQGYLCGMSEGYTVRRYNSKREAVWMIDMGYVVKSRDFLLDYFKTFDQLQQEHQALKAFIFNGYDPRVEIDAGLRSFYTAARNKGFGVQLHPMLVDQAGRMQQKRVDVDIAAHLLLYATMPNVSHVYLTTGDSDLYPAVQLAREHFKTSLVLFTYDKNVSNDLVTLCTAHRLFERGLHGR